MSTLIARCAFKWTGQGRTASFKAGDEIGLSLDARQVRELVRDGLALEAATEQEKESLRAQLVGLYYPEDGCPEMGLDLVTTPSAPVTPRVPGQGIPLPPVAPMTGKLTEFGKLLVGSQLRKRK